MDKQKGFTIIELIVVIAIIAVLAGIVLVNVTAYINKAKDVEIEADMRQMQTIAGTYYSDPNKWNGSYSSMGLIDPTSAFYKITSSSAFSGWTNNHISSAAYCFVTMLHTKDSGGNNMYWCIDSTGYAGPPTTGGSSGTCNSGGSGFTCK